MRISRILSVAAVFMFLALPQNAKAEGASGFQAWTQQVRAKAQAKGISQATLAELERLSYIERVIELDRRQPERTITFDRYRQNVVNQDRIKKGRELLAKHRTLLDEVSAKYGVPPQYIVALWGIETNFGGYTGNFDILNALATLAYEGRRREFFEGEFLNALQIIDQGHITRDSMKGSWAGAMGQNQFMPSSFKSFAVDYTGDGRKDIWNSLPDIFASMANYLARNGWNPDIRWGRQVSLKNTIDKTLIGNDRAQVKTLAEWQALGVRTLWGADLPNADIKANLIMPDGVDGQAFLAYSNYQTIMRWNRSTYFATSVGLLADQIAAQ